MCDDLETRLNRKTTGFMNKDEQTNIHYLAIIRPSQHIKPKEASRSTEAIIQKPEIIETRSLKDEIRDAPGGLADTAKKGYNALVAWTKDNSALLKYVLDDQASLAIMFDNKGNTVGHFFASLNEEYALKLLGDPQKAAITNNDGDSVCLTAVRKYDSAAIMAANNIDLWCITDPNSGNTVGHNIAKNHESIIIEVLKRDDAADFLSVENDRRITVANVGTRHHNFSLFVLDHPEIYSLPLGAEGASVACDAVKNHFSSAIKVDDMLRRKRIQMSDIGQYRALEIAVKDKLADLAMLRKRNGNGIK